MTKASNRSSAVTQFWYMLEQLTPFDLTGATKNEKFKAEILNTEEDLKLPWLNPEMLTQQFKLPASKNGKPQEYDYQVYLGVFPSVSVTEFIQSLPKDADVGFEETFPTRGDSCYASFKIGADGLLVDGSLTCSAAPWALKRIGEILTNRKQLDISTWAEDFRKHVARLQKEFSDRSQVNAAANHKTTVADLQGVLNLVSEDLWKSKDLTRVASYVIQRADRKQDDTVASIINSFYLDDLAAASTAITGGTASPALQEYLTPTIPDRKNVEGIPFLQHWLSPKQLPLGRWASNPEHSLSLMQQLAVNLAIEKLKDKGGVFSVNGPPGTGKTTLLRDLIADLIVQRAEKMTNYPSPAQAFSQVDDFYRLHSSLTGFEIIVSSSNNAAVENVSVELPSIEAIDEDYQDQTTYFRVVSESIKAVTKEPSEDRVVDRSAPEAISQQPIQKKSSDSSVADTIPPATWGLIAATLGKKANCTNFCTGFWDKAGSINALLREETNPAQWDAARQDFYQRKQTVLQLVEQRQHWYEQINTQDIVSQQYRSVGIRLDYSRQKAEEAKGLFKQALQLQLEATESLKERENYLKHLKSTQPSFSSRLFNNSEYQHYHQRMAGVQQEIQVLSSQLAKRTSAAEEVKTILQMRDRAVQEIDQEKYQLEQTMSELQQLSLAKANLGDAFGDDDWWNRLNEERQGSAPWVERELNQARTELFLAALNVHEQFIKQAAVPIRKNLGRWVDLVKGDRAGLTDDQILYLWQTLFLVVPVVSTTLASVQRLFDRLPPAAFGWLLIDEAGQGIPQAVVGALQRSKRAIIVGDPSQIEPVFTLDKALVKELQNYFGIEDCWSPVAASIQTICDRANSFGTNVKVEGESTWIGCPLWVHRRCIEPMATISNKIAYEGKMVIATRPPKSDKQFPLGESRWIDVRGKCQEQHWVTAQGEEVIKLLAQLVAAEQVIPSLYIISPFKAVARKLGYLLQDKKSQWSLGLADPDVDNWIKKSVGTVHTFQGKEADVVIFVLGGDESSAGALNWASSKPNILNVAATRAKYRLYLVGDRQLWSELKYFDEASDRLPCEVKWSDEIKSVTARPILRQKENILIEEQNVNVLASSSNTNIHSESAVAKSSDNYFEEGLFKLKAGDYQGVIHSLTAWLALNPNPDDYQDRITDFTQDIARDPKLAISIYDWVIPLISQIPEQEIVLYSEFSIFYRYRGLSKYQLGDYRGAINDFTQTVKLNPKLANACYWDGYIDYESEYYEEEISGFPKEIILSPQLTFAKAYYHRGCEKESVGDDNGAITNYNRALELNHKYVEAYYSRGLIKYKLGDDAAAIDDYHRSELYKLSNIHLNDQNEDIYYNRGIIRLRLANYRDAIFDFTQAIELNPTNANAYYNRGVAKYELGEDLNAIPDFTKAIELNPQYAIAYNNRGVANDDLAGYDDMGDYSEAISDFTKAIELNPQYAIAYNNRGIAKYHLGAYDEAIIDYAKAIELNPQYADAYYWCGLTNYRLEHYEEFEMGFDQAIEIDPQYANAYYWRGLACYELEYYEGTIADFIQAILLKPEFAIDLNPKFACAYYNRGNEKYRVGDYQSAISDFNRAIEINSQYAGAYYSRSLTSYKLENYEQTICDLTQAIALDSRFGIKVDPLFASAYHNQANTKYNSKDYLGAIADYSQAIFINPQATDVYYDRGDAKYNLKDYYSAISDYDIAISLNTQSASYYNSRGETYAKLEKYEEAISDYRRAMELDPDDDSIVGKIQELEEIFFESRVKILSTKQISILVRRAHIQNISNEKGIEKLVHFTNIGNLNSILSNGLIPREYLERDQNLFLSNDEMRLDKCLDATSLSISFPNYKMFYYCVKKSETKKHSDWVVLELDSSILWELECAFCFKNAASSDITTIPIEERQKPAYLSKMFEDNGQNRHDLNLPDNYPTDPQAEVLCFGSISPEYIKGIHFYSKSDKNKWILNNDIHAKSFDDKLYPKDSYFHSREDYSFWTKK